MSTFQGLEIAKTGLFVSQKALEVTGHNIANANTPGYTRQVVDMASIAPPTTFGMYDQWGKAIGEGVKIVDIRQIRDQFLDNQYRRENKFLGEWETKAEVLSAIENIFNEPSSSGITAVLNDFFNSLQELSKNPESLTVRAEVRERAIALADTFNMVYQHLYDKLNELNSTIQSRIAEINSYAERISRLNGEIYRFELSGQVANDLRDQRNLLVDQLSKLVNITTYEDANGNFRIDIGGQALVSGTTAFTMSMDKNGNVIWDLTGSPVNPSSGVLKGLLDMRNGDGADGVKGVPYYMEQWNKLAYNIAEAINKVHSQGYGLDGSTGKPLFGGFDTSLAYDKTTPYAQLIRVSSDILASDGLLKIAAAKDPTALPGDNRNALELIVLRDRPLDGLDKATFDDFARSLISNLGVDAEQANVMKKNQEVMVKQIDLNRQSVSGVSLDEEMTNMLKYQKSYAACARVITAMDELIDTVINRMGIVGR
ncbi:flagellar hook-associated protein 1 FlgK [Caldanaerobacter subterraneus subsp. tengcongensis MB4]|uniref:Flagellar hook-associated protein 1 n=1 Tax=Caldanaerobacter subterraneus subsp. tengcongensis (strain DSM 15242 / JCM 11007 / NBRC 100824 / MB4) TaxID=273068 RepID=Q8RCD8_CALS4|nr:flagellar hook-associated protein FlgK [Caldanaerobacter subterraneus]AAM23774.1 Flagellar hook-associated protein [Caldanaerobacter subterraneus subsp. tengcongensis MB4]MCS3916731.1 flagellar hook-associated protein 1 FlgK [Caldanaerobacter subterraneus subsp. tengcongensis MB4]